MLDDGTQENLERDFLGVGGSLNVNDDLYLAVTYQYIMDNYDDGSELNPFTLDVAASLTLLVAGLRRLRVFSCLIQMTEPS